MSIGTGAYAVRAGHSCGRQEGASPQFARTKLAQDFDGFPANTSAMARQMLSEPDLERALLRKSVRRLGAGRYICADCGRTPLIGERVHSYAVDTVVCELCRPAHATDPNESHRVRSAEFGLTVRVMDLRPARAGVA